MIPAHKRSPPVAVKAQAGLFARSLCHRPHHAVRLPALFAGVDHETAPAGGAVPEDQHVVSIVHDLQIPFQGRALAVPPVIGLELGEGQTVGPRVSRRALVNALGTASVVSGGR